MKFLTSILTSMALLLLFCGYGIAQDVKPKASMTEIYKIHDMILESDYEQLHQHFKNGGNVNAVDAIGNTPLHFSAKVGDQRIVNLLIKKGANVDQANDTGTTPLMIAAKHNNTKAVKILLENGADAAMVNNSGFTARTFADIYKNNKVRRLLPN